MSEERKRLTVKVADDKSSTTVSFLPASGASGSVSLTLEQLTVLITALGDARARMVSGQTTPPLEGQPINAVFNTRWYVQPEPLSDGSSLTFLHPAYGPVGFVVPRNQVVEMVRLLSLQIELPIIQNTTPN